MGPFHCLPVFGLILAVFLGGCPPLLSPGVLRTQNLVYGKGSVESKTHAGIYTLTELRFDLIEKEGAEEVRPAVLMIHGGGFEGGSKEDEKLVRQADALARAGYVCFLIDYRLKGDHPPAPDDWEPDSDASLFDALELREAMHAAFVDAKVAIRYIRANASSLRVDPERIAVWGESAGAFAALAVGLTGEDRFSDDGPGFTVPPENNPGTSARVTAIVDCWGSAAPVIAQFDLGDPPVMIVHGTQDFTVGLGLEPAIDIRDACEENGVPVAYYPISGAGHGAWDGVYEGKNLATLTGEFLAQHLGTVSARHVSIGIE